ncbi:MAG: universal stress protein [Hyphomicrobiaceae bacterium]
MFKHILAATDGSDFANSALTKTAALAKALSATVTVATVSPPFTMVAPPEVTIAIPPEEYRQSLEKHAQATLAAAAKPFLDAGLEVKTIHVPEKNAAEGLIEAAEANGCDLITMASHGRRGLTKLILGSTAQEVVTRAHIPVLIYRD